MLRNLGRRFAKKALSFLALPLFMAGTDPSLTGQAGGVDTPEDVLDGHIMRIAEHHKNNLDVQTVISLLDELRRSKGFPSGDLVTRANSRLKTLDTLILGVNDRSYLRQKLEHLLKKAGKLNIQTAATPSSPPPIAPSSTSHTAPPSTQPKDPNP